MKTLMLAVTITSRLLNGTTFVMRLARRVLLCGIVGAVLFAQPALADFYTYTGNTLTTAPGIGIDDFMTIGTAPAGLDRITFTMTGYLGPDRPFGPFFPASWSISDGALSFSSSAPPPNLLFTFDFATNTATEIIEWNVTILTFVGGDEATDYPFDPLYLLRTIDAPLATTIVYDESSLCSSVSCDFLRVQDYRALSFENPGVWTVAEGPDVPAPVREPSTLLLLGSGLAGLGFFRRRGRALGDEK